MLTETLASAINNDTFDMEAQFETYFFIICVDTLIQNLSGKFRDKIAEIFSSLQILLPEYVADWIMLLYPHNTVVSKVIRI